MEKIMEFCCDGEVGTLVKFQNVSKSKTFRILAVTKK